MDEEDKIINNKPLFRESYSKDEFSVESRMLHHCGVEGQNGSKKADGVTGVFVAGCWIDRGRWSRISWLVWLVVARDIDSKGGDVVEGNRVQVWASISLYQHMIAKKVIKKHSCKNKEYEGT